MTNFPDETAKYLAKLAEELNERYFRYIPDLKRRYPFHRPDIRDQKIIKVTKSADGSQYTCIFRDQYVVTFSSGRFAPGTQYERDPPVVSDRSVIRSVTEEYKNDGNEPQTRTRKITKSQTKSRTISAEHIFRALASAEAGIEIKFITAGGKTEAEYTTTTSESDHIEQTDTIEEEIPLTIPPNSTYTYTESVERVTSRQTLRATGIMNWKIHVDIYNLISITFESIEQMHLFFTGQLSDFPYGTVSFGDPRRLLYGYCKGETNAKPPAELLQTKRPSDEIRTGTQEIILKTEDARSGIYTWRPLV